MFDDRSFDVVFSNSVIEHVPQERRAELAATVLRLAPSWWVQTPSKYFPIEAHCNLPFWWFYPEELRKAVMERWRKQGRSFRPSQMATTSVLTLGELKRLFRGGETYTEYVAGWPKSHAIYRR